MRIIIVILLLYTLSMQLVNSRTIHQIQENQDQFAKAWQTLLDDSIANIDIHYHPWEGYEKVRNLRSTTQPDKLGQ